MNEVWLLTASGDLPEDGLEVIGWAPTREPLKAEAERREHGQRRKPRTYRWEDGPEGSFLRDTRGGYGGWQIERLERIG